MIKKLLSCIVFLTYTSLSFAQQFEWVKGLRGVQVEDMVIDNSGNKFLLGSVTHTGDADPGPGTVTIQNNGISSRTFFLGKYTTTGNLIWAKQLRGDGINGGIWADKVRLDLTGNPILLGSFSREVDFDLNNTNPHVLNAPAGLDMYIAKYNTTNANLIWVSQIRSAGAINIYDATVDASGNISVGGQFRDLADFDPDPLMDALGQGYLGNGFLASYNSDGTYKWAYLFGEINGDGNFVSAVTNDAAGNVYATGQFMQHMYSTLFQGDSVFMTKITPNGAQVFFNTIEVTSSGGSGGALEFPGSIHTDNSGNFYITGSFYNPIDFAPGSAVQTLNPPSGMSTYLVKYSTNGTHLWGKAIGASLTRMAFSNNRIYAMISMDANTDIDFGSGVTIATQEDNLAIYTLDGDLISHKYMGRRQTTGPSYFSMQTKDITTDGNQIYIYGWLINYADFDIGGDDTTSVLNPGTSAGFFAAYNQCRPMRSEVQATICRGNGYQHGSQTYTEPGTYSRKIPTGSCDSTVVLTLSVTEVDTSVFIQGHTLTANINNATYQWIDCDTDAPITGASQKSFTPIQSGKYKARIISGNCTTHSACYEINIFPESVQAHYAAENRITLYPNPVNDLLYIKVTGTGDHFAQEIFLVDITGRTLQEYFYDGRETMTIETSQLAQGTYFIKFLSKGGTPQMLKFTKQ